MTMHQRTNSSQSGMRMGEDASFASMIGHEEQQVNDDGRASFGFCDDL